MMIRNCIAHGVRTEGTIGMDPEPEPLYVDPIHGNDETGDGSKEKPFLTVRAIFERSGPVVIRPILVVDSAP